jgi:hypothetical protein
MPIFFSIILLGVIKLLLLATHFPMKVLVLKTKSEKRSEKIGAYLGILQFVFLGPLILSFLPLLIMQGDTFLFIFNDNIQNYHLNFKGIFKTPIFTQYLLMLPLFIYQPLKYLYIINIFGYKSLIEKINKDEQLTLNEKNKIIDLLQFDHELKMK